MYCQTWRADVHFSTPSICNVFLIAFIILYFFSKFKYFLLAFCLGLNIYRGIIFIGNPKKQASNKSSRRAFDQSADTATDDTTLDEEELVSIATLKQMLDVQQSMIKTLFDSFISTVNARVDKLADSVASLKASLEFTQKNVEDLSSLKSKLVGAEKDIVDIKNTVELQANKLEYQENQCRRNNIRVFGIPESAGETWEMAETKVRDAIKEKLDIEVDIERAHRTERRKCGGINQHQADAKPRVIVCRLSSWKQKEAVVRKARKEKPEGLLICEDLSQATLEKRKPHLEKLRAAKQAGKSAYFILDRLIIRDKPSGSSNG